MRKLVLPDQLLGDRPEPLAYRHIVGERGRRYLLAVGEVLPTHTLDLRRGCQVEHRLRSFLSTYAPEGVDHRPDDMRNAFRTAIEIGGDQARMERVDSDPCSLKLAGQFIGKVELCKLGLGIGFHETISLCPLQIRKIDLPAGMPA